MIDLPVAVLLLIYALAAARLTGLVVQDSITEPVREALIEWLDDRPKTAGSFVAALVSCVWCSGMWISVPLGTVVLFWPESPFMLVPATVLAFSQITGMIHDLGR